MNRIPLITTGPLPAYRARLAARELATDPAQALAAERLQSLWAALRGYDPHPAEDGSFLARLFRRRPGDDIPEARPHGLYLVGEVGRGKSMLMDLFFATADVPRKRRIHFHQFMQEAHASIHAGRSQAPDGRSQAPGADPIPPLADRIAAEAALLCLDEMQVNDVADAMILGRLFEALFARGVVVVATSNTRPADLFAGQPGRDAFLPFIALIEANLDLLVLDGAQDWRRRDVRGAGTWHVPADTRADRALDEAFTTLTGGAPAAPARLTIMGHTLTVPLAAAGVARFGFDALCGQPLGAGDYLALATHYQALVLDGVPRLSPENYDMARRFITLVDALYDHRTKLVASAEAMPDQLYQRGEGARAFARTASRLEEMRGEAYWALPHLT